MKKRIIIGVLFVSSAVFAGTVNVVDFGAVPNDGIGDQEAFVNAFTSVIANGGGKVSVPAGDYQFDSRKVIDLRSARVEWIGQGTGVSRIFCMNTNGIVWFNNSNNDNELIIKDISFMAGPEISETNAAGFGTAIQINNPSLCTNDRICSLYMENVVLMPPDWSFYSWFDRNIYTSFLSHPQFVNVITAGPYGPDSPSTPSESGFRINYGADASFTNCYAKNSDIGYFLGNMKGDVIFDRCNAVSVSTGFVVNGSGEENCSVENINYHVNARIIGLKITTSDPVSLRYGAPYWEPGGVAYTDISIIDCSNVDIVGNIFHVHYTDPVRTLIHLQGSTSNVLIKHNIFNAPGNRVVQDSGVTGVTVTQNHDNPVHVW